MRLEMSAVRPRGSDSNARRFIGAKRDKIDLRGVSCRVLACEPGTSIDRGPGLVHVALT